MKIGLHIPKVHNMTTDTVDVISTSAVTADASPVVLSQTEMIWFKFCPTPVDNEKAPINLFLENFYMKRNGKTMPPFRAMTPGQWLRFFVALSKLEIGWNLI